MDYKLVMRWDKPWHTIALPSLSALPSLFRGQEGLETPEATRESLEMPSKGLGCVRRR